MLLQTVITLIAVYTVRSQKPSPCPDILTYEPRESENDRWNAVVNLRAKEKYRGIWLSIVLDRPADLLGNAFGDATTTNNKEFLIRNNNYILEAGETTPIGFFVKYNAASIIPSVTEITLNGRTICQETKGQNTPRPTGGTQTKRPTAVTNGRPGSSAARPITTTSNTRPGISSSTGRPLSSNGRPLGYTDSRTDNSNNKPSSLTENNPDVEFIRPESVNTNLNEYNQNGNHFNRPTFGNNRPSSFSTSEEDQDYFIGDFSSSINNKPPSNPALRPSRNNQCGVVTAQAKPLISYGQETVPGQWPWHAALFHFRGVQQLYTCGGNLISTNHILTAAHCVTKLRSNKPINPGNILVYLGKHSLRRFGAGIQEREIADIFVHPEYNTSGYYNDVAILRLEEPVEITKFVRPVCLWSENTELHEVIGRLGTVVGWGFDETGKLTDTLMQSQMPIVGLDQCLFSNREFFSQFTSDKTFCAGFLNGTSVCNGDSGGGMVLPRRGTKTVWQIRGIVSVGVPLQGQNTCDPSQYVVITDVAKHLDWIKGVLRSYP